MSDEDHKLTVETETVEAPGESLLPSTNQAQCTTVNENFTENGNVDYDNLTMAAMKSRSSDVNDGGTPTGAEISSNNNNEANSNNNVNNNGSTTFRDKSPAHTVLGPATHQPVPGPETNFNLIDHNPLSTHGIQSLKHKKSTLLINNGMENEKMNLHNSATPSVSELPRRNRNEELGHMPVGGQVDQRALPSSHSSKGTMVQPPAVVKPKANTAGGPIIQRPSLPLMNSREILLKNETHNNTPKESKEPERTSLIPTNSYTDNTMSSSHNEEEADSLHKPTKADFFAARLASAVGENEISDSEETFIYESAADSTKNTIPCGPAGSNTTNDNSYIKHSDSVQHGVANKMSVPVLNNNAKLLNRLKSTRHTSLSGLPANPSIPFTTIGPTPAPMLNNTSTGIIGHPSVEDLDSVKSFARQSQRGAVDLQSVKSFSSESRSPDKRMSLVSLAKGNSSVGPIPSSRTNGGIQQQGIQQQQQQLSRKPSLSNSTLRNVSISHIGVPRTKPEPPGYKRKLRTTASRIFDTSAVPLRRHGGVPDGVNLEDYIEQHANQDSSRMGHELGVDDQVNGIHEEEEAAAAVAATAIEYGGDVDEDDIHSMFFYNHRTNLESLPQISDYEEDGEDLENNNNGNNGNPNGNATYVNASYSSFSPYANEYTPLKQRKYQPRSTLGHSPHNFYTRKPPWAKFRNFLYFSSVTCMLLTVGFILGFLLASNKELQDFNIVLIDNVLSSADELVFDVTVSALNPGFLSIEVQNVDLDIFAKSYHLRQEYTGDHDDDEDDPPNQNETVLLGTSYILETPLTFHGNMLRRKDYDISISSVKLLDPGSKQQQDQSRTRQFEDDVAKWKHIIKHDYQLIVRGNMRYKVPYGGAKSVSVQSQTEVKIEP